MSRANIILRGKADRDRAARLIDCAPAGTRVEFKASRRTVDQNSRMWAMLTEVSRQLEWHGQKLRPDDWKILFLDALKRETRAVPNLDGSGVVDLSRSSSDLSKHEMSDMIDLIAAFGAEHGVFFNDPTEASYAA